MTIRIALESGLNTRSLQRYGMLAALAVAGIAYLISYRNTIPAEDAIMLFEYSRNLASEGVITYGSGNSVPIEGATDFLFMVLIALISKLGASEFAAALILNYSGLLLICYLFHRLTKSALFSLIAILTTSFFYASLEGFSTMVFASAYVLSLYLVLKRDRRLYLATLGLCLIRPDGVMWGIGLIAMRLLAVDSMNRRVEFKYLVRCLILPGLTYFAWRLWYFREWLPLPFIVKASAERPLDLTIESIFPVLVPTVGSIWCAENRWGLVKQVLLLFLIPIVFYCSIRMDQNSGNRYLSPMFFGMLMLLASQNMKRVTTLFLFLWICLGYPMTVNALRGVFYSPKETTRPIGLVLAQLPRGKLLSTEAGRLAYYSGWVAEDSWGLNTPKFAHRLITAADVNEGRYDLIVANCKLDLLKSDPTVGPAGSGTRTWLNQCRSITEFLRTSSYDIFLVPFFTWPDQSLSRNSDLTEGGALIYAISPSYAARARLESVIHDFKGVPFNNQRTLY